MSTSEHIGEKVHLLMWKRRIGQKDLAPMLGIGQPALSRKLRGERPWTIEELLELGRILDVPLSDLLPGDAEREIRRYPRVTLGDPFSSAHVAVNAA